MVSCPFRTVVVIYRMFTFVMCLIGFIFGILFLHLSTSFGYFCPLTFFLNNRLDSKQLAPFISDLPTKHRVISRGVRPAAFRAVDEPLAACMMVRFWVYVF